MLDQVIRSAVFTLCILFSVLYSHAQQLRTDPKLDSLLEKLTKHFTSDSLHALAYEDVIWHYIELADDEMIWSYLDSLKAFGADANYPYATLLYEFNVGYFYFRESMYDSALNHMHQTLHLADELKYPKQKINALTRIATLLQFQGNLDSAMHYLDRAESFAKEIKSLAQTADVLVSKATLEYDRGNYLETLDFYLEADSLYQEIDANSDLAKNRLFRRASVLMNIALLHHEQLKNHERALSYILKSKELYNEDGREHNLATVNLVLARIHATLGNVALADSVVEQSLAYFRSINHPVQIARAAMLQGTIKLQMKKTRDGERLLLEAKSLYEDLGTPKGLLSVHTHLGQLYRDQNAYEKGIDHFQEALSLVVSDVDRTKLLRELAHTLSANGAYSEAYQLLDTSIILSDSINETQLYAALQESEMKYQTAQKEKEIVNLKLRQSQQEIRNQQTIFWSSLGLFSLLTLALFYFYRSRQKTRVNRQLKELDELKSKMFSDISHEFRTPLSLIKGPVEVLTKQLIGQPQMQQELDIVNRNTTKLNHLVDSVQDLAKLDAGKMILQIRPANLYEHLKIIGASFESRAASKALDFHIDLNVPERLFYYDPKHLETILYNLLSNAFKFTPVGDIILKADIESNHILIKVSDTGIGLSEAQQEKIFERYYRVSDPNISVEGVGIGLALAFELANLHHGSLEVHSILGSGATFSLSLPISEHGYISKGLEIGPEFIPFQSKRALNTIPITENITSIHEDEPVILLVEDNVDMRQYLESLFTDEYSIIHAKDGKDGLEKAKQFIPDIIISDLMMPLMDGQDLLRAIKTDPVTSHIPFVMLTANHLEEEKIKGLEQRVDDYMTKPFSIDEIKLKVSNLIQLREQLKLRYQQTTEEEPSEPPLNETEDRFWTQLQETIQDNLDNADFSAEDFAKAMFMSRMQLHRKLKALTNLSTTIFLRTERLKAAKKLLQKPDAIIANVAYDVGFNSPSFFSKCFKEQYGMTPKEVQGNSSKK